MENENETDPWSTDGREAIELSFCRPGGAGGGGDVERVATFRPEYLEQFFGQGQAIFGYRGLRVAVRFAAHDLYPNVAITWDKKFPTKGVTEATDVRKKLAEILPDYAFEPPATFDERLQAAATDFTPPGECVDRYTIEGRAYEIWRAELRDPAVRTLIERVQILIPMLIDGGLALDVHDQDWTLDRWRVFFVYEKLATPPTPTGSPYSLVGYATAYRFLTYQPATATHFHSAAPSAAAAAASTSNTPAIPDGAAAFLPTEPLAIAALPNKTRISQFLILPPAQKHGHGPRLYAAVWAACAADPACVEVTVEDPNEAFDDLRDVCDYSRLLGTEPRFVALAIPANELPRRPLRGAQRLPTAALQGCSPEELAALRRAHKLAPRQFARLVELRLLAQIPLAARKNAAASGGARLTRKFAASDPADRALYSWRLLVKQRVCRQNRDALAQLDVGERVDRLDATLETQASHYEKLLEKIERFLARADAADANGTRRVEIRKSKRKVIEEDDEEEEGENEDGEGQRGAKRPRQNGEAGVESAAA